MQNIIRKKRNNKNKLWKNGKSIKNLVAGCQSNQKKNYKIYVLLLNELTAN